MIKIRAEINEVEQTNKKNPYKESMKQKAVSLKKINKMDRPLTNLTKMRREKTQISKIRSAWKFGESETTLRTYILRNLKM
jgi:hypothetical protein